MNRLSHAKHESFHHHGGSVVSTKQKIIREANKIDDRIVSNQKSIEQQLARDYLGSSTMSDIGSEMRVEMAAVLLFDAINNLTTRHRVKSKR